jgi:hypothetical protein
MDWDAFFRDYPAVVAAVAGLLGIVLGFVFNNWIARRKRKDELQDREFNRRVAITDSRIKEARDCLNAYHRTVQLMQRDEIALIIQAQNIIKNPKQFQQEHNTLDDESDKSYDDAVRKRTSIFILNDAELHSIISELNALLALEQEDITNLYMKLKRKETIEEATEMERVTEFERDAIDLITAMQTRLDGLAQSVK